MLQRAEAEKRRLYDEALRGRQNEKAVILGIETSGRMHRHFYQLLETFSKVKADANAGPLDSDTDPEKAMHNKTVLARAKAAFMSLWVRPGSLS